MHGQQNIKISELMFLNAVHCRSWVTYCSGKLDRGESAQKLERVNLQVRALFVNTVDH